MKTIINCAQCHVIRCTYLLLMIICFNCLVAKPVIAQGMPMFTDRFAGTGWAVFSDVLDPIVPLLPNPDWEFAGFGTGNDDLILPGNVIAGPTVRLFVIPHWFLILLFAILPAIWLFKWNKRRELGPNACPSCGYDLTGNESGVCSECGVEAKAPEASGFHSV